MRPFPLHPRNLRPEIRRQDLVNARQARIALDDGRAGWQGGRKGREDTVERDAVEGRDGGDNVVVFELLDLSRQLGQSGRERVCRTIVMMCVMTHACNDPGAQNQMGRCAGPIKRGGTYLIPRHGEQVFWQLFQQHAL